MCNKTVAAVNLINSTLQGARIKVPTTEHERVKTIRFALNQHAKTRRADFLVAARILSAATCAPDLWTRVIDRAVDGRVSMPENTPAHMVGITRESGSAMLRVSQIFVWSMVALTLGVITVACTH
jgi:hypothetical protein